MAAPRPETTPLSQTIHRFRPSKSFPTSPGTEHTSLDFSDNGEFLISSLTDETLHLYNTHTGTHSKTLYSKKYGAHLAKFTHSNTNVLYASTKGDDTIRYLSLHDNSYIRYFRGHKARVNALEVSPTTDEFLSCSADGTVRLWDLKSSSAHGVLKVPGASVAAFDPSGIIFAVASHASGSIMLYDCRNYDKQPFSTLHLNDDAYLSTLSYPPRLPEFSKLEFSNDGKLMLLGTRGPAHYMLDSFADSGRFLFRMERKRGATKPRFETGGDVCFTPDGRYVVSGQGERGLVCWDVQGRVDEKRGMRGGVELGEQAKGMNSVVAFNPRLSVMATANQEMVSCCVPGLCGVVLMMGDRYFGCRNNTRRIRRRVRRHIVEGWWRGRGVHRGGFRRPEAKWGVQNSNHRLAVQKYLYYIRRICHQLLRSSQLVTTYV